MISRVLSCPSCGWRTLGGADELASRLRLVGQLRRETTPDPEIILELLPDAARRMTCPGCKSIGLVVEAPEDEQDDADWQAAVLCEICRKPIPPERIEAIPGAKRCAGCQQSHERGDAAAEEPDFCPRCGSLVELRVSRGGGITRYRRFCTGGCRL